MGCLTRFCKAKELMRLELHAGVGAVLAVSLSAHQLMMPGELFEKILEIVLLPASRASAEIPSRSVACLLFRVQPQSSRRGDVTRSMLIGRLMVGQARPT